MRLNWILDPHNNISYGEIHNACKAFYDKYKVVPDTVKLTYKDFNVFISQLYQQGVQTLERGKKYGLFLMIPGGMVELMLLEQEDESVVSSYDPGMTGQITASIMVVESLHVDREFEKHILNKEDK